MKSGVNLSEWMQSVNKANSTISRMGKMKTVSFSQTNARPFT